MRSPKLTGLVGLAGVLLLAVFHPAPALSQTCTQTFTLRQESCPGGVASCTSKGATLNYQELDRDIINSVLLCNAIDDLRESMLRAIDSPADEECLTYESGGGGDFEWQTCGGGGGGSGTVTNIATGTGLTGGPITTTGTISLGAHATQHKHGGTDEVATSTPAANAIPKAGAGGTLGTGWFPALPYLADSLAADDTVPTGSGSAWQAKTLPNCVDTGGNHLNYTAATNTWSCGTTGGGGAGEANTASNLGGGLANFSAKVSLDLQFNSFAAVDFDLGSNLITIDDTKWAKDSELPTEAGLEAILDLPDLQGAVTDAQVPNTITINTATQALTGDSATAFFGAGQLETARGGTGIDSSASTGVPRVASGTWTVTPLHYVDAATSPYNVAVGASAATNNAGIAAAIAALPTTGGIVQLPCGLLDISSKIILGDATSTTKSTRNNITLRGCGTGTDDINMGTGTLSGATRLRWTGAASATMLELNGPNEGMKVENLVLDANSLASTGIDAIRAFNHAVENVMITKWSGGYAAKISADRAYSPGDGTAAGAPFPALWQRVWIVDPQGTAANAHGMRLGSNDVVTTANTNNFTCIRCVIERGNSDSAIGVWLGHTDHDYFIGSFLLRRGATTGKAIVVASQSGGTDFPTNVTFTNTPIIGGVYEDSTAATWSNAQNAAVLFYPLYTADGQAIPPVGANSTTLNAFLVGGYTDTGLSLMQRASLAGNQNGLAANQQWLGNNGVLFEGSSADLSEGFLTPVNPTADRTWTLPNESGTVCTTGSVCTGYAAGTAGVATTSSALAANGTNCSAGQAARGVDAAGNAELCFTPAGGGGLSTDAGFLVDGGVTSLTPTGAGNEGKMQVMDSGGLQYTDGAGALRQGFLDADAVDSGSTAGRSLTNTGATIDADDELYERTKCMLIETPVSGDDLLFFRSERAATITGIDCLAVGGTSVALLVKECDTAGATCGNSEASITCGATNTTESGGIDDAAIDAGDWMRVDPGTVTGSVTQLSVCVTIQVAD